MTTPGFVTEAMESLDEWLSVFPIEHLDEDWAVPCEVIRRDGTDQCVARAEWIGWRVLCCPNAGSDHPASLWCTRHKDEVLAAVFPGQCNFCLLTFRPYRAGFRLIEPLNRRTT